MSHDRTGDPDPTDRGPWHDPRCRDGWLGENADGKPIPCYVCRPHLRHGTRDIGILKPEWEQRP